MLTLFIVIAIIAVLVAVGGGYNNRYWSYGSFQPWVGVIVFLLVLWLIFHFLLGVF